MVVNITFLSFLLFSMCKSIHDAVNTWINCSFFYINLGNDVQDACVDIQDIYVMLLYILSGIEA